MNCREKPTDYHGEFDLVAAGRALLQDPEWAAKMLGGRFDELKPFDAVDSVAELSGNSLLDWPGPQKTPGQVRYGTLDLDLADPVNVALATDLPLSHEILRGQARATGLPWSVAGKPPRRCSPSAFRGGLHSASV